MSEKAFILTPAELETFTGKTERAQKRYNSQAKELELLHIPYTKRSNKTLIVYRCFVDPNGQTAQKTEPASLVSL